MLKKPIRRTCLSGIAAICNSARLNTAGLRNGIKPSITSINAEATHRLCINSGFTAAAKSSR